MTTLTKLPRFHTGTDTHNLPGNRCEIDWTVLTTLAATTAGPTPEQLADIDAIADSKGLAPVFADMGNDQKELFFKAMGVYSLLIGAADVAREMHDFEACSRLASHAIVALNWIPRFDDDDLDAPLQINEDILRILATGEGRMPDLILWLRDHFNTPQPKGFAN